MCICIKLVRSKVRLSGNARIASVHGPPYLFQRLVWPMTVWVFLVSDYTFTTCKMWSRTIITYSLCVCTVCVNFNNDELFLMLSRLKIHFILVLDRLRHGA